MAKFQAEIPKEVLKDIEFLSNDFKNIFGGMTHAGAEVVYKNVVSNVPSGIRNSDMMNNLKISKVYETPSDDGINSKVLFAGYFINENGVETPAPLVANVFEYGSTKFSKQPFFRKSFKKAQIQNAMLKAQKELSRGILNEWINWNYT